MTDHPVTQTDIKLDAILREICGESNVAAYLWINQLRECIMFFDHVYDEDGNTPKEEIVRVITYLTVDWGLNPFYRQHSQILSVVIMNAIRSWMFSNDADKKMKFKAYDVYSEVATTMMHIIGGRQMIEKYDSQVRELIHQLYLEDEERDGGKL